MHLNNSTLITEAKAINFNVVEVPPTLKRQKNKNKSTLTAFNMLIQSVFFNSHSF